MNVHKHHVKHTLVDFPPFPGVGMFRRIISTGHIEQARILVSIYHKKYIHISIHAPGCTHVRMYLLQAFLLSQHLRDAFHMILGLLFSVLSLKLIS